MTREAAIELLKNRKVYVNGKSAEIQQKLFELGWKQWDTDTNCNDHLDKPFIYIDDNMKISYDYDMRNFISYPNAEISADEIIAIEVVPECSFKPFDRILGRDTNENRWQIGLFAYCRYDQQTGELLYYVCMDKTWGQCIPYEGNEHLLGTTNSPEEN